MLNKAMLIGNLGRDPEVKNTSGGDCVASFNLATTESWTKDGKKEKKTDWHKIVAWGRLGEICGKYLAKGSLVYIEGKIQTRQWEDKDGNKRYTTEIVAREMKMLTAKGSSGESSSPYPDEPPIPEQPYTGDVPF